MVTLPNPVYYYRPQGGAADSWTLDADGSFPIGSGATLEVVSVGPSKAAFITRPGATETHVFLLFGQSQGVGRADHPNDGLTYPPGTLQYGHSDGLLKPAVDPLDHWDENPGDFGPWRKFCLDYAAANPGVNIALIPRADGGTAFYLNHWNPGDPQYVEAVNATNTLLAANPSWQLTALLWHLGQTDANSPANFRDRFYRFADQLRIDIDAADESTPFIIGNITPELNGFNTLINTANNEAPNFFRRMACVDLAGVEVDPLDPWHYTADGYNEMGARYQAALATAAANTMPAEVGATAHWRFGFANRSYRDFVSGQTLTENEAALTHALNYSTVVGQADGLASSIQEQATMTACFVIYTGASSYPNTIIGGTLTTSGNGSDGHSLYLSAGQGLILNERGGIGATAQIGTSQLPYDSYAFVAVSLAATGEYIVYVGGATSFVRTGTGSRNPSTRNYSIGDVHYNSSPFTNTCRFASAIFFMGQAKTQLELDAIYAREKAALALRGLAVL